ncbi:protein cornichon homolog 4 isoform X1 [Micropterus salmoides]|uniref:protein cornichon homolog 4 isoform X1 n=1 Tax=Micropterus salmoides TaxID=27706 RepID=UPI0018EDAFEB|nr:protein cornichon homolog 4 isoform X1 [Micropterus salmoides]
MEAAVFILSLVDCCALIFLSVYFIITLSDLECDYINARACCSKLNKWVIPEMVGQCLSTMLMLVSMHWFIFLLNLPVAAWNIYRSSILLDLWGGQLDHKNMTCVSDTRLAHQLIVFIICFNLLFVFFGLVVTSMLPRWWLAS